jgi:hypothetical protein
MDTVWGFSAALPWLSKPSIRFEVMRRTSGWCTDEPWSYYLIIELPPTYLTSTHASIISPSHSPHTATPNSTPQQLSETPLKLEKLHSLQPQIDRQHVG